MDINSLIDKLNNEINEFNNLKAQYNEFKEFYNSDRTYNSCAFSNDSELQIAEIQIVNNVIFDDKIENKIISIYENSNSAQNCTALVVTSNKSLIVVKTAVKSGIRISAKSIFASITLSLLNFFI